MNDQPTTEPTRLTAGDTWEWSRTDLALSRFPAPTWALSYALRGPSQINITATPSDQAFTVTVPAETSAVYKAGDYEWAAYVTNSTTSERYQVATGHLTIAPNLAGDLPTFDGRSYAKRMLDAIEATILGRATEDANELAINGKKIVRMTPAELITLRDKFRFEYANERKAERIRKGLSSGNRVLVRFK